MVTGCIRDLAAISNAPSSEEVLAALLVVVLVSVLFAAGMTGGPWEGHGSEVDKLE